MDSSSKKGFFLNPIKIWQITFRLLFKFLKVFVRLMKDRRVPWYAKAMPCLAIVYILSPFDIIPDFLVPFIGGLDDLVVLFIGFKALVSLTPQYIIEEHISRIEQGL